MAKTALGCSRCGYRTLQWQGRCPQCGAWDSMAQVAPARQPVIGAAPARPLAEVGFAESPRLASGIGELDRVLGGGLVTGSVVLLAGEPGVGKSTLTLQAAAGLERAGRRVLLVCGEESLAQVAARAGRLGGVRTTLAIDAVEVGAVLDHLAASEVAVIDSVQTLHEPELPGEPGSVSQVRGCALALARRARESGTAVVLVGHVTKDGAVAGPRVLEHLVDAVLVFEGDRGHTLRTLRSVKNRFGQTSELGVFEMTPAGLVEVPDASGLLLRDRVAGIPGSAVGCVLEGRRPLVLEVQTLVVAAAAGSPRTVANGVDASRVGLAAAVLEKRAGVSFQKSDLYASVAGGFRVAERGIDLALSLALAGARQDLACPDDLVAIGEVGLGGEVRAVPGIARRLSEAARLGFRRAVVPRSATGEHSLATHPVADLREALQVLQSEPAPPPGATMGK